MMNYKVGIGYDIHRLVEERPLIIGGVEIPYLKGLLGHSDADVLLHAISDALLGAIGSDDIGELFPDTDAKYENISSIELLKKVLTLVKEKGFHVNNIDTIIIAEEPKLTPFKKIIRQKISELVGIGFKSVNVKAKTNEGLGETGKSQAIASYAVVTVEKEE